MKGEAPLGNKPLYTASSAFLMREDSTKRSNKVEQWLLLGINVVKDENVSRTINKQEENELFSLIVCICEMSFCGPIFRIVSFPVLIVLVISSRPFGRRNSGMKQFFPNRISIY